MTVVEATLDGPSAYVDPVEYPDAVDVTLTIRMEGREIVGGATCTPRAADGVYELLGNDGAMGLDDDLVALVRADKTDGDGHLYGHIAAAVAALRPHPDPLAGTASVHVDSPLLAAAAHVDRLTMVLPTGQPTYREDTTADLVDHLHTFLRDSNATVTLRIDGLTRHEWDAADGLPLTGWRKRREHRHPDTRQLIAVVEYDTDEGWD